MGDNTIEERYEGPMSDGEYIRKTDYKDFKEEPDHNEVSDGCQFIRDMLRQEYLQDYKLQPPAIAINNVPRHKFPFNRHTVTIGVGNVVIDFEVVRKQHEKVQEEQKRFAEEIEKVKEEMEKVRLIESAWYDDFLNNKYINDLTADLIKSRGIGDACAPIEELFQEPITHEKDENGIIHVKPVAEPAALNRNTPTVKPRGRFIVPYIETTSPLPNVSV
ncbi:uncharacterized protein LOC132752827 [Ruditapes philippinarum]|uniref:uncharacterized protein LOC132752827 n=1 Tax=Ruditapes philippinarum TaxID=129788 RepID=UPI00295B3227|nr:uncharacterized protein LOC132752827 [Ruditapes philippinarum]